MEATLDRGRTVRKYLAQYTEPEARTAAPFGHRFKHVVVIPAAGEGDRVVKTLASIPPSAGTGCGNGFGASGCLVILVVNARATSTAAHHQGNSSTFDALGVRDPGLLTFLRAERWLDRATSEDALLVVNRAVPGRFLPEKQGVGLARKIGADLALAYWAAGFVESNWICCTDADALLPADYFTRLPEGDLTSSVPLAAVLFPFAHRVDPDPRAEHRKHAGAQASGANAAEHRERAAIELYELFLRYQRLGLLWAGSPYAYHSVGSTISIDARSYAAVRGFPKKMAGEDFYLLNKLAKVGGIHSLDGDPIVLSGRISDRVPFGTGRAMSQLVPRDFDHESYSFPDPRAFDVLRIWVDLLERWIHAASTHELAPNRIEETIEADIRRALPASVAFWVEREMLRGIADRLAAGGGKAGAGVEGHAARAVHGWFDSFRTMMFLRGLRDRGYPDLPYTEALRGARFLEECAGTGLWRSEIAGRTHTKALESLKRREAESGTGTFARAAGSPRRALEREWDDQSRSQTSRAAAAPFSES
jgi:hypothetical protein